MPDASESLHTRVTTLEKETETLEQVLKEFIQSQKESHQELDRLFSESAQQIKETDQQLKETAQQMKQTDRRLHDLIGNWGKFVETLVHSSTTRLFREWGLDIVGSTQRMEKVLKDGRGIEIDVVVHDTDTLILVEAKTTLKVQDVIHHVENRMMVFHEFYPEHRDKKIYGAVAFINCEEDADRFAYKNGLFVLSLTGDGIIEIRNDAGFEPKDFNA